MRSVLMVLTLLFFASPLWAKEIAGVQIEEMVTNEAGTTLQLNGAGIRKKLFFKIYIAQLYLENPQDSAEKAMGDSGAKRLVMHFIYDEVGKDKIVEGWQEGFLANVGEQSRAALQPRIEEFNAMFTEDMRAGDVIIFDYLPGQGTRVKIKGEDKGIIEGKDFSDALLSIWLGEAPVSADLKKELLQP